MKNILRVCTVLALAPFGAQAESIDAIGGADGATQTIHHCGFLPSSAGRYTNSNVTTRIVEEKLAELGYSKRGADGIYGKADKKAVRAFQRAAGIRVDGIVGPITAKYLAFNSHPSANVKRCYRNAIALR